MFEDSTFEEEVVRLQPRDMLVLFSDGITEAVNTTGEEFGDDRLIGLLAERCTQPADEVADAIINAVMLHARGMPQGDDMTVLIVQRST